MSSSGTPADIGVSKQSCPVCGSTEDIHFFLDVPGVPILCNVLWRTREEALSAPRGDLRLGFCRRCGHVYNYAYDPELLVYTEEYENSLHFSSRFQRYAEELADRLIERFGLRNRDVIEIGCGQGDFLEMLCRKGGNRGIGFDPSFRPPSEPVTPTTFRIIPDLYGERYSGYPVDFICSRHVLEHVQQPVPFLETLRHSIGDRRPIGIFFEVPDVAFTLKGLAIWDLIYEHCSYFSRSSLSRLFSDRGFEVRDLFSTFDGQFLCIEALAGVDTVAAQVSTAADLAEAVITFPARYREKVDAWRDTFATFRRDGRRAVVWGAGSKGVSILNVLRDDEPVEYVVDLNPRKHGMHVSGTGQRIVPPEFLREYRPDVVVGMNAIYADEIRGMLAALGIGAELVMA
jgi:SAM-dependent methyltransferase